MEIDKRIKRLDYKCKKVDSFNNRMEHLVAYPVKVADSCPITIEMERLSKQKKQLTE